MHSIFVKQKWGILVWGQAAGMTIHAGVLVSSILFIHFRLNEACLTFAISWSSCRPRDRRTINSHRRQTLNFFHSLIKKDLLSLLIGCNLIRSDSDHPQVMRGVKVMTEIVRETCEKVGDMWGWIIYVCLILHSCFVAWSLVSCTIIKMYVWGDETRREDADKEKKRRGTNVLHEAWFLIWLMWTDERGMTKKLSVSYSCCTTTMRREWRAKNEQTLVTFSRSLFFPYHHTKYWSDLCVWHLHQVSCTHVRPLSWYKVMFDLYIILITYMCVSLISMCPGSGISHDYYDAVRLSMYRIYTSFVSLVLFPLFHASPAVEDAILWTSWTK
jgi:hypothetical protein